MRKVIDLSVTLKAGIQSDPPAFLPQLDYVDHVHGASQLIENFPNLTTDQLPGGEGWAVEFARLSTHAGTHIDAPYHYRSRMDSGEPSLTIDQIPLDWFFGPGVKLDFRQRPDGHVVDAEEIKTELERINHELSPGDIVLINTAAGDRYGHDDFVDRGCGVGREGTLFLTSMGIRVVGTDAWSWDAPFSFESKRFDRDHDASKIWEGHFSGSVRPYCQIEKLANLDQLPSKGFEVICLPVKVERGSAGWARPVALLA